MKYSLVAAATFLCGLVALNGASLKTLNVAAVDASGQPVTDLRAPDFQIQEDGKSQKLVYFRFTGGRALKEVLKPGEFSNRAGVPSHVTVILVDLVNDRFLSGGIIGKQIGDTLKKLETGSDVYLYFLTSHGDVFPVHGLPEAGSEETPTEEPWTKNAGPLLDLAVKKLVTLKPIDDRDILERFKMTASALDSLGGQMWQIPGRKNLVWVTHGVPLIGYTPGGAQVDFTSQVRLLAGKLAQAQIAVYAVQQSLEGAGEDLVTYSGQMLDVFASLTGGRIYRTDYADGAILQARIDSRGNYEVAYDSDALNANGKHHKIRAISTRKGVRLQTQQEFYALGLTPSADDFERAALELAATNPEDATEIGLRGSVSRDAGAANSVRLDLQIARNDVLLREVQGRYVGKVSVNFSTYDGAGQAAPFRPVPVDVNLTAQQYEAAAGGIAVVQSIPVGASARKIRAIVIDKELRAAGSITIPIGK